MYYKNGTITFYKPNKNVPQNSWHTIFSGVADCMTSNLGFNELMCGDSKICKSEWLLTLAITEKFNICKGGFLARPWSLMSEFSNLLSGAFVR